MLKLATVTTLMNHIEGLELHLQNLRWAVNRPHRTIIVTSVECRLPKEKYPDVEFLEITHPKRDEFYDLWGLVMPSLLYQLRDHIIIFTQIDQFYHRQLGEFIDDCVATGTIQMNSDLYGWDIYKDGKIVHHRVWEGGQIVPADTIVKMIDEFNIGLGYRWQSPKSIEILNTLKDLYLINPWHKPEVVHMPELLNGEPEVHFEFSLFCYYFNQPVKRSKYLVHFPRPERFYREYPLLYGDLPQEKLSMISNLDDVVGSIFMCYLSGVTEWHHEFASIFRHSGWLPSRIAELVATSGNWMSDIYSDRLQLASDRIQGILL